MKIKPARTPAEIETVRDLFREYEAFLNVDLCFQGFEKELTDLPGRYTPPTGELLIGLHEDKAMGCAAVREIADGVCEMKRLYVKPEARGTGLGRKLAVEIIRVARKFDYSVMRLDTLSRLKAAMCLYEALGFQRTVPYYENPLPGVVYWVLDLKNEDQENP